MNRCEFDYALAAAGLGYGDVAERLGISGEELEEKLSEVTEFTPEEITTLAQMLGLTPDGIDIIFFGGDPDMEV